MEVQAFAAALAISDDPDTGPKTLMMLGAAAPAFENPKNGMTAFLNLSRMQKKP